MNRHARLKITVLHRKELLPEVFYARPPIRIENKEMIFELDDGPYGLFLHNADITIEVPEDASIFNPAVQRRETK